MKLALRLSKTPALLALTLSLFAAPSAWAQSPAPNQAAAIAVLDPYVRLTPPSAQTTAAFMRLKNNATSPARLVRATSPAARVTELHTHLHENGIMRMRQVPAIEVPAGGETELKPGGLHIMLIDLPSPLKDGQKVSLTLDFADGSSKLIEAPVRKDLPAMRHGGHGGH